MTSEFPIYLIGGRDDETAIFALDEGDDGCELSCSYRGKVILVEADDYFDALCEIRQRLASEGLIPFCYGASLNVYPSGMSRSMGGGLKAYRLTSGRQALMADIVEIFAEGPDIIPASVELQKKFFEEWLRSLGS